MQTMKRNARTLTAILALVTGAATLTRAAPADDRNWATRVKCELQTAGGESLQTLTWQQGTTPRLSLDQYRSGKELIVTNAADTNVVAIVRFGPSSTGAYFVSVTNYATVANAYLVNMPTVGTNTTGIAAGWWYTVLLERGGSRFWTGNGRLDIVATTSTGDGLVWQTITSGASMADLTAEAALRASGDRDGTNYTGAVAAGKMNTNSAHSSLSGIGGAGTLHVTATDTNRIANALTNTPTLQQVVTAGGGAAVTDVPSLTMSAGAGISGQRFGYVAGSSASGDNWGAFGYGAGYEASGNNWGAYGYGAGYEASGNNWGAFGYTAGYDTSGNNWGAFGYSAGYGASGDNWGAYGYSSGQYAVHTNSHSFGRFSGFRARGNNRMYLDVYAADPGYPAGGATNDTIFMDSDGKLYLGGGAGRSVNPSAGGVLRGTWDGAGVANIPLAGVTGLQGALDGKVATNGMTDTIHGVRGGLNLHTLADANGAGFYSADHYKAVTSMKGRTNVWDSAVPSTPTGIAAAGGVTTNSIPGPGCTYLGTSQAVTLTGATTSYRAEPAGVYTVSVAQAASRYTYALEVISTNPCTLAAGLNLQGSWTITGTNILAIVPCTGTLWRVYGRGL